MGKRRGGRSTAAPSPAAMQQHGGSLGARALEHLPVWAAAAALPPAAWGLGELFVDPTNVMSTGLYGAGALAVGGALTGVAWHAARARGQMVRVLATAGTSAAAVWELVASLAGPFQAPYWQIWAGGSIAVCGSWSIKRALRGQGSDTLGDEEGILTAITAGRGRWGRPVVEGSTVRVPVHMSEGTPAVVQAGREDLEARISARLPGGLHPGAITVTRDPQVAHLGEVTIATVDHLRTSTPWPGTSRPGGSIADPIVVGVYADGRPMQLLLPGAESPEPRPVLHLLTGGASGSGKSVFGRLITAEVSDRHDVELIVIDPTKGIQTIAPIEHRIDWPVWDADPTKAKAKSKDALAGIYRAGLAKANWLGEHGYDQWLPGCGLPFTVVQIEELATLASSAQALKDLLATCRSGGIGILGSLQRPTWDNIDTSARNNFGGAACFGTRDEAETGHVLPDEAIDAGAAPHQWGLTMPGAFYYAGPGVEQGRWAIPARTFDAQREQLAALPPTRRGLCSVTAEAIGAPYAAWAAQHGVGLRESVTGGGQPPSVIGPRPGNWPTRTTPPAGPPVGDVPATRSDLTTGNYEEGLAAMWEQLTSDIDADVDPDGPDPVVDMIPPETGESAPDIDAPLGADEDPPTPDLRLAGGNGAARVRGHIVGLARAGAVEFAPGDLADLLTALGRSASWLSKQLNVLIERGWLTAVGNTRNRVYLIHTHEVLSDDTDES
ncbi:hypothetical protein [Cryptosporangium japonicum]|uniref:FtsK domain-containing protein n=1 Tax=Cryptosporangium japonicum TaxID=80872 RepID=A0ABP3EBE5_9ACTN